MSVHQVRNAIFFPQEQGGLNFKSAENFNQ